MVREFQQIEWDAKVEEDCRALVRLAVREDLEREQDWTTLALVPADRQGAADLVTRERGIVAGMPAIAVVLDEMHAQITSQLSATDGQNVEAGSTLARLQGNVRDLLTCERTLLNLISRLMGVATLTGDYVEQVQGTSVRIYDTRKTTPGWRRLEKYAVRYGGGFNHRIGLYDAILVKDNHLAQHSTTGVRTPGDAAEAVQRARDFLQAAPIGEGINDLLIEIEVDALDQLASVLSAGPDIVLLDNMNSDQLRMAVEMRNQSAPAVKLEASGGIRLETLREVASTGVDRISSGALTHSARSLDIGMDWQVD